MDGKEKEVAEVLFHLVLGGCVFDADGLRAQREKQGWTAAELAELCGIPNTMVTKFERGSAVPKFRQIIRLACVLGCDVNLLMVYAGAEDGDVSVDDLVQPGEVTGSVDSDSVFLPDAEAVTAEAAKEADETFAEAEDAALAAEDAEDAFSEADEAEKQGWTAEDAASAAKKAVDAVLAANDAFSEADEAAKKADKTFSEAKREIRELFERSVYRERVLGLIDRQIAKGAGKYGVLLEDNVTLNTAQRIEHLQEELIDGLMYAEHLKAAVLEKSGTLADYQRAALRTAGDNPGDYILNGVLGLCGETGECGDILKKHLFQGHELDREHLIEELGDVFWYLAVASAGLGVSLDEVAKRNVDKLERRYPEGFSKERSIHRDK